MHIPIYGQNYIFPNHLVPHCLFRSIANSSCLPSFAIDRGPEIELSIGDEGTDPVAENDWSLLPFMALSDGAHTYGLLPLCGTHSLPCLVSSLYLFLSRIKKKKKKNARGPLIMNAIDTGSSFQLRRGILILHTPPQGNSNRPAGLAIWCLLFQADGVQAVEKQTARCDKIYSPEGRCRRDR